MSAAPAPTTRWIATWLVELRPGAIGSGFKIENRTRILSWYTHKGLMLPVTAYGRVSRAAFIPSREHPESGMAFVEVHPQGSFKRFWWSPLAPECQLDDERIKKVLADTARGGLASDRDGRVTSGRRMGIVEK